MKPKLATLVILLITGACFAQTKIDLRDVTQFSVENRTVESAMENGQQVFRLSEAPGDGLAILKEVVFDNGTIEFDVKGRNVLQQSFVGLAFHVQDRNHYDAIYFRPFNFMNQDTARRSRAVQYIAMPDHPWEKLRQQHPGKYESKVSPVPDPDGWFHVKVVIAGKDVRVYVDHAASPCLQVERLGSSQGGKVAMWTGNGSNASFANLVLTPAPK